MVAFGKRVPVMLRFLCLPTKKGGIGLEFVVGRTRELTDFDFEVFDEHRLPSGDRDMEIKLITPTGPIFLHSSPGGWDSAEIPGGFTFGHMYAPIHAKNSIPRKIINQILDGATELQVTITDKQQPGKSLVAQFSLIHAGKNLKLLTTGLP